MNFCSASEVSGFVNMSVVLSEDRMYLKRTCPSLACSFTKWCLMSMCLVWRWFLLFKIELSLSAWMIIGSRAGSPISSKYLVNQRTWVVAHMNAMYPAHVSSLNCGQYYCFLSLALPEYWSSCYKKYILSPTL